MSRNYLTIMTQLASCQNHKLNTSQNSVTLMRISGGYLVQYQNLIGMLEFELEDRKL